jgi:hypothetical protein
MERPLSDFSQGKTEIDLTPPDKLPNADSILGHKWKIMRVLDRPES